MTYRISRIRAFLDSVELEHYENTIKKNYRPITVLVVVSKIFENKY